MTTEAYQKNSLGWQLHQTTENLKEWIALQLSKLRWNAPQPENGTKPDFSGLWQLLQGMLWVLLGLLILGAIWRIWQGLAPYLEKLLNPSLKYINPTPELRQSSTEWLKRSQTYQKQGNYYQACRCLYLATLELLDQRGLIPHQSSRTDLEYRFLLAQIGNPHPYHTLLDIHQQLCYGEERASAELLGKCQQAYQEINQP